MKTKILLSLFILLLSSSILFSQTYTINSGGTINTCSGTLYDSGGASGNYGSNETYSITICSNNGGHISLNFTEFNTESGWDELTIHDGSSAASATLVNEASGTSIRNRTFTSTGTCLHLVWESDASGVRSGFAATISCSFPCQNYTIAITNTNPPLSPPADSLWLNVCLGSTVSFTANGTYPNNNINYPQTDDNLFWQWAITHGTTADTIRGTGRNNISYTFNDIGGHRIIVTARDQSNCSPPATTIYRVRVSLPPETYTASANPTEVCAGDLVEFNCNVVSDRWSEEIINQVADSLFLLDGSGVTFFSPITNRVFPPTAVVGSSNDITSICVNMEHTYMGDLSMRIVCPNGQFMQIFTQAGGGTIMGEPVGSGMPVDETRNDTRPGIGYDYCWSPTSTSGNMHSSSNWETVAPYIDRYGQYSSSVSRLRPGTYQIDGNWNDLIGCPLNGSWSIEVTDHLGLDNGWLFSWQINFAQHFLDQVVRWDYSHTYSPCSFTGNGTITTNSARPTGAAETTPTQLTYISTVTDDFGCPYTTNVDVTLRAANNPLCCIQPTPNAGADAHVCSNTYTFMASPLAQNNTGTWALVSGPGTATWANQNSPTARVTVNTYGVYTFSWTERYLNSNTCFTTDEIIVEFWPQPTSTFTHTPIACFGEPTTITYTGNMTASASYIWNFGEGIAISGNGIGPILVRWDTAANNPVSLIVSENGCTSETNIVSILNPIKLTHSITLNDDPCYHSCKGKAELTVSGGTLPYTYSWTSPTNRLENVCAGTHSVTVTDANGCTSGQFYTIHEPLELLINSISSTNLLCYNSNTGSIEVNASGGTGEYRYFWSDIGAGTSHRINLAAGEYCVTVEDEHNCTVSQCVTLTQPEELIVQVTPSYSICEGTRAIIQAQAVGGVMPYSYNWDRGEGYSIAAATLNLGLTRTTELSVYVLDKNGCRSNTARMTVTVSPKMIIDTVLLTHNTCYHSCNGRAELVMRGGLGTLQYSWVPQTNVYSELCAGMYTITVTDIIGCSVSSSFIITEPDELVYSTVVKPVSCHGYNDGEINLYLQGGVQPYTYLWHNGHNSESLVGAAGTYNLTITDGHNCRIVRQFQITEPTAMQVLPLSNTTICQGQTISLNTQVIGGTPEYDFRWTGNDGSIYNSQYQIVSPTRTTIYTLIVTDANNCTSTPLQVKVAVHPKLEILSILTSNDTVCPGEPARIFVDVIGGNGGPYTLTLQDGRVVPSPFIVHPQEPTMYTIRLNDMCSTPSVSDSIFIYARPKPGNVFTASQVNGCPPLKIDFTEKTPENDNLYHWTFGDTGFADIKNPSHTYTAPGTYSVTLDVRDAYDCKHTRTITNMIHVYEKPTALFDVNTLAANFIAAEFEFINHSLNANNFYWYFGDGDSSLYISPRHLYKSVGEFDVMLVAMNDNECTDTTIRPVNVENHFTFYMPTSFTPNGDGVNDCIRPCANGIDKNNYKLTIYDRWGNIVFETTKYDFTAPCTSCATGAWDGTRQGDSSQGGKILPNNDYRWTCDYKDLNGTLHNEYGYITLIR